VTRPADRSREPASHDPLADRAEPALNLGLAIRPVPLRCSADRPVPKAILGTLRRPPDPALGRLPVPNAILAGP
jgi:hypothetical protein